MGTCHEFGPSIQAGCDHPMQATRPDACTCAECGVVCHGRFPGCATVWARGPQAVHWKPATVTDPPAPPTDPGPAPERSGPDELISTLRALVAEVARLRADVDELRGRPADLPFRAAPPETPADSSAGTEHWQGRTA